MLKPQRRLTKREMKEDKLVTFWFQSMDFINHHSKEIVAGAVAVVGIILVLLWFNQRGEAKQQDAAVLFTRAKEAYDRQEFDVAVDSLIKLVNQYTGTRSAGLGCIYLANSFMQKEDFDLARDYYQKYLDDYGDDPILSATAACGIAATYDESGEYAKAAELYEKAGRDYDDSYRAPEFLMRAARCYNLIDAHESTRQVLSLLIEKYPDASVIDDAKLMRAEIQS